MEQDVVSVKQINDQPTISRREARRFFGWSVARFNKRYDQCFYRTVSRVKTRDGMRYVLTDVIKCAFPQADNYTVHRLALDYLFDRHEYWSKDKRGARSYGGGTK